MGATSCFINDVNSLPIASFPIRTEGAARADGGWVALLPRVQDPAAEFSFASDQNSATTKMFGHRAAGPATILDSVPYAHNAVSTTVQPEELPPEPAAAEVEHGAETPQTHCAERELLALYGEYRLRLYRYARSMQLAPEQAEEVVQETFMRLIREYRKQGELENVRGWIVRVAHNLAINVLKKEKGSIVDRESHLALMLNVADPGFSPEETYSKQEQSRLMYATLSSFKPLHRSCFQMRAQGLLYKEIGRAMGISEQRAAYLVKQVSVRIAATCGYENVR